MHSLDLKEFIVYTLLQRRFAPGWKVASLSVESHTLLQRRFAPGWKVASLSVESHTYTHCKSFLQKNKAQIFGMRVICL